MIGTITYILARAGWRAMNGQLADERRRLAGAEPPAAYVSYDPRLLAGVGWYGYRIAFKGGDRQMMERARYMLSERYTIRDSYEYFSDGVYVIGVLLRQRVPHYGIGGGVEPTPEPDVLNFTMPNGGTISLDKIGSPTVVELEYSIDRGQTWIVWQPDNDGNRSLTLSAGQRMYVRNISETQTGFSTSTANLYQFAFTDTVEAHGNTNSLLCKNAESVTALTGTLLCYLFYECTSLVTAPELPATTLSSYGYYNMFRGCTSLTLAPELPATTLVKDCYVSMFYGCTSLVTTPELPATTLVKECYYLMFYDCTSLQNVRTQMTDISADNCLTNWLRGVAATGDFYCPAELTIPTGASGIPSGWTRHDI